MRSAKPDDTWSDDERDLHALNIHGDFFEAWCRWIVGQSADWHVLSFNYPVDYPPPTTGYATRSSELDICATHLEGRGRLTLLMECKKANPEFVNWVFFPVSESKKQRLIFPAITYGDDNNAEARTSAPFKTGIAEFSNHRGRETRGNYQNIRRGDWTRTATTAIADAAMQVAIATNCVLADELSGEPQVVPSYNKLKRHVFVPGNYSGSHPG